MKMLSASILLLILNPFVYANFVYNDFSSTEGLQITGDAFNYETRIRLTPSQTFKSGSVYYSEKQTVQHGFETSFAFQITDTVNTGADGIWFNIRNTEIPGYKALWVELDTWNNVEWSDPSGNHIGVFVVDNSNDSFDHVNCLTSTSSIPDMSDGNIHNILIKYYSGTMSVFLDNMQQSILSTDINLSEMISLIGGQARIEITASTGSAWETHDLLNWSFTEIPEPATFLLFGLGGLFLRRMKRR
jgi:hypothetical protein